MAWSLGRPKSLLDLNEPLQPQHARAGDTQVNPVAVSDELREASRFLDGSEQIEWPMVGFHQLVTRALEVRLVQS
jgi:hypothetical protein